jgi:hypothetical protein
LRLRKKASVSGVGVINSNLNELYKLLEEIEVKVAEMVPHIKESDAREYVDSLYAIYGELDKIKEKSEALEAAYEEKRRNYEN